MRPLSRRFTTLLVALIGLGLSVAAFAGDTIDLDSTLSGKPLRPALTLRCQGERAGTVCQEMCRDLHSCEWKESSCQGCLGTALPLFRILFESPHEHFRIRTETRFRSDVLSLLERGNFVTVHSRSLYNFSTRYGDETLEASYRKLCPVDPKHLKKAFILVETDPVTQAPREAHSLICVTDEAQPLRTFSLELGR